MASCAARPPATTSSSATRGRIRPRRRACGRGSRRRASALSSTGTACPPDSPGSPGSNSSFRRAARSSRSSDPKASASGSTARLSLASTARRRPQRRASAFRSSRCCCRGSPTTRSPSAVFSASTPGSICATASTSRKAFSASSRARKGKAIDAAAAEKLLAGLTPYRGLLPFREQDAGLFFGRERFVEELVRKVGQRSAANVVAVIGRSGSGKSSIVYAGLFPALRRERGVGDQSVWQILHLRPHAEPLNELALAFNPPKADLGPVDRRAELNRLAGRFRNREVTLAELVRDRLRDEPGSTRLLLYVDQWEELYTLAAPREPKNDEERARAADVRLFIDLVLEAAAKSSCTLVLSARSDFYPDIQNHDGLRIAVQENQVSLGTMNEAELRAVIEGPPKALGASVDPEADPKAHPRHRPRSRVRPERRIRHRQAAAARICARTGLGEADGAADRPGELFRARTGAGGAGERALRPSLRRGAGGGQAPVREPRHARRGSRGHPRPHRHAERRRDAARDPNLRRRRGASHRHRRGRRTRLGRGQP